MLSKHHPNSSSDYWPQNEKNSQLITRQSRLKYETRAKNSTVNSSDIIIRRSGESNGGDDRQQLSSKSSLFLSNNPRTIVTSSQTPHNQCLAYFRH